MATYRIDFSTNASRVAQEIDRVNKALTEAVRTAKPVEIRLDDVGLSQQLDTTFKKLDKEIAKYQRQLRKIQIGAPEFGLKASQIGQLQGERERAQMTARAVGLRAASSAFPQESFAGLSRELEAARITASMIQPNTEAWTNLQREIARLNLDLKKADKLAENVQLTEQLGAFAPRSLDALEARLTILRNRAREISPNEGEWKRVNREIVKTEQAIEKQTRRPLTRGQRLGAAGGAFLYGGGFSGAGSAVGGIAGGLMGGVPGAFTGAAIGQVVDSLTMMTAAMTEQAVAVQKLRLGLASASNDLQDYAQSVREVEALSNKLLLPLDEVTRKFTQLKASTVALGIDAKTTSEIFEGTAAAVLMSGGSLGDVDGAMRAVVQVFSKGKLTAEELRGQLGERLPGAVVEFAKSSGRSLQELDKAFEQGGATLDEFVVFLREKKGDTEDFVKEMANSSEFAGARMAKAFERLRINIGKALQPTGAAIQDFVTRSINGLDRLIKKAIELELIQPGADFYANRALLGEAGGIAGLEQELLRTGAEESASRESARAVGLGFIENLIPSVAEASKKVRILEDALKRIRKEEALTKKRDKEIEGEREQQKQEARAQKFLDTIERREEALASARESYEQEIRGIRENAIKQAEALERRYKDQRLQDEREIGRVRRELAAAVQEEELLRRGIVGEDPALLEQERKIGDAIRQYTEDKISREEEAQDRQIALSRELEDFKRQNADAINKANERYANAIGKIQQEYAKSVAKLVEEGSGNGAKKLAAAGKFIAALISQASAQQTFQQLTGLPIRPAQRGVEAGGRVFETKAALAAELQAQAGASGWDANAIETATNAANNYFDAVAGARQAQKDLNAAMQVTAKTATVSLKAVSTADIEAGIKEQQVMLTAALKELNDARDRLGRSIAKGKFAQIVEDATKETTNANRQTEEQNQALSNQIQLINGGVLPAVAEEATARKSIFDKEKQALANAIKILNTSDQGKKLLREEALLHSQIVAEIQKELDGVIGKEQAYASLQRTLRDNAALLEAAQIQSQIGIVGQGLRAGFLGEAGAVFEQQIGQGVSPEVAASVARATEQLIIAKTAADALQGSINGIGAAFGEAMTTGVASLISGTATAKEVFASFLQSVAQALAQAASQMIATYIAIGIAKMFAGLNGGGAPSYEGGNVATGVFNQGGIPGLSNTASIGIPTFANGGVFADSIVSGPTMFKFADGGALNLGLMGEAGPEAIMPLKRGPDGRLGVSMYDASRKAVANANGNASMDAVDDEDSLFSIGSPSAARRTVAAAAEAVAATRMQVMEQRTLSERRSEMRHIEEIVAKPAKINVEYQSQVINNVEYVTRDQAERMAAQSALRGRELALSSLQNSVKARKRVGMS